MVSLNYALCRYSTHFKSYTETKRRPSVHVDRPPGHSSRVADSQADEGEPARRARAHWWAHCTPGPWWLPPSSSELSL